MLLQYNGKERLFTNKSKKVIENSSKLWHNRYSRESLEKMKRAFNELNECFKKEKTNYNIFYPKDNYHSPFKDYIESRYSENDFIMQNIIIHSHRRLNGDNARESADKWRGSL